MSQITIDLVRKANKRHLFNKKNNIPHTPPTKDIWGNDIAPPPQFPFKYSKKREGKD